jgi:cell division septal protein FtsQ
MASSGKKRSVRKTKSKAIGSRRRGSRSGSRGFLAMMVPVVLVAVILAVFGSAGYFGYRAVVASSFFKVKSELIEVVGLPETDEGRARREEIARLVEKLVREDSLEESTRKQSFLLDIAAIGQVIADLDYVRSASVARRMPDGLRVSVVQRERVAVFRIEGQPIWFDEDGEKLDLVSKDDPNAPFVMRGWNPADNEIAIEENRKRIELYVRLKTEWTQHGLTDRVVEVDATDLRSIRVTVNGNGGTSVLIVGNEDYVNRLKMGLEAMKTGPVQSIDVTNGTPVVVPRAQAN